LTKSEHRNTIALARRKTGIAAPDYKSGSHDFKRNASWLANALASRTPSAANGASIMPDMPQAMPTPGAPAPGAGIVPRPPGAPGASPGIMTPTPAAAPSANLGAQAKAAGQMKQALTIVEMALPHLPLDSPLHKVATSFITGVAKHLGSAGGQDQGIQASMLRDLALRQQQQAPALRPGMPPQGGAPAPSPPGA
jgi:hypothetical protein